MTDRYELVELPWVDGRKYWLKDTETGWRYTMDVILADHLNEAVAAKDAEIARLKYSIEMYQGAAKKAAIQENSDVHLIKALSDETEQLKAQLAAHREFVVLYRAGLRPLYEICNDIDVGVFFNSVDSLALSSLVAEL